MEPAVGAVRVKAPSYLHKRGLLSCVRSAVSRGSFASTGAATVVTLPLEVR